MNHTKHSSGSYSSFHAFDVSLLLVDAVAPLLASVRKHDKALMDQLRRATQSVALNVAEGAGNNGGNRRVRYESALGSAYEVRAALHIAWRFGYVREESASDALAIIDELGAMLWRLSRR